MCPASSFLEPASERTAGRLCMFSVSHLRLLGESEKVSRTLEGPIGSPPSPLSKAGLPSELADFHSFFCAGHWVGEEADRRLTLDLNETVSPALVSYALITIVDTAGIGWN